MFSTQLASSALNASAASSALCCACVAAVSSTAPLSVTARRTGIVYV